MRPQSWSASSAGLLPPASSPWISVLPAGGDPWVLGLAACSGYSVVATGVPLEEGRGPPTRRQCLSGRLPQAPAFSSYAAAGAAGHAGLFRMAGLAGAGPGLLAGAHWVLLLGPCVLLAGQDAHLRKGKAEGELRVPGQGGFCPAAPYPKLTLLPGCPEPLSLSPLSPRGPASSGGRVWMGFLGGGPHGASLVLSSPPRGLPTPFCWQEAAFGKGRRAHLPSFQSRSQGAWM